MLVAIFIIQSIDCCRMDKYEKIEKPREEAEIKDNEIRITTKGKMRNSISYATTLFKVRAPSRRVGRVDTLR